MTETEMSTIVTEILVENLKVPPESISADAHVFEDLGLDSVDLIATIAIVEQRFGIQVLDNELADMLVLGDAIELLTAKVAGG